MSIDWKHLRPLGNSQNTAFEELCCQLAACEPTPAGSRFIRKGVPDAGVECFWQLPDGSEIAWQAKFFDKVEKAQWAQLDESVKKQQLTKSEGTDCGKSQHHCHHGRR